MNAIVKPWSKLARRLHRDERGAIAIETVLIICAVALPILIFVILNGWPMIKAFFNKGMTDLQDGANAAQNN